MRFVRVALALALTGVAALYVALGASNPWDFQTYYHAARACRAHLNPYDLAALSAVAGKAIELPFLYPPVTLLPFLALSFLPFHAASLVWLGINACLLVALLAMWRREFLAEVPGWALLGVALFGFNAATLWDLRTGNVAMVEAFLLWAGFLSYVRGKTVCSARRIAGASIFKIAPIAFLGVLLVGRGPRKTKAFAILLGVAMLAAALAVSWPLTVEWARALPGHFAGERPTGEINPSALGILDGILGDRYRAWALPLFGVYACVVALVAIPAIRKVSKSDSPEDRVMVGITLWVLLSPRVMIYSYMLMVVPALFVVRYAISIPWARTLGYVLLMAQGLVRLLPGRPPAALAEGPFILGLAVFAALVARIHSGGSLR
jgi:glycosyl transferase family 87